VDALVICILYSEVFLNPTEVFLTLTDVFACFFLSCKANASVKLPKIWRGPHSSTLLVICGVWSLFVLFYVLFVCKCVLPPGDYQIAVNIYRMSQEECARLRVGVPYVKVYRYNPKHLCPKLNGYGHNGQRSLKL